VHRCGAQGVGEHVRADGLQRAVHAVRIDLADLAGELAVVQQRVVDAELTQRVQPRGVASQPGAGSSSGTSRIRSASTPPGPSSTTARISVAP